MFRQMPNGEYKWLGVGFGHIRGTTIVARSVGGELIACGRKAPRLPQIIDMNGRK